MKNSMSLLAALGAIAVVSGCSTMDNGNRAEGGYYLPQKEAQARGGVANYVDRNNKGASLVSGNEQPVTTSQAAPSSSGAGSTLSLKDKVYFEEGSARIKPEARNSLISLAKSLSQDHRKSVKLIGRADDNGTDVFNQRLSQDRAESVKSLLRQYGVEGHQVVIEARGERDPLVPNRDDKSRAENRTVEIFLG